MRLHLPLLVLALGATSSAAAEFTQLAVTNGPFAARYSQAVTIEVALTLDDGTTAIPGARCQDGGAGQPCRVVVSAVPSDGSGEQVQIFDPAVDAEGHATVRMTLVDDRPAAGTVWNADDDGFDYTITARFLGKGVIAGSPECEPGAQQVVDGDLCPTEATATLTVTPEVPDIALGLGVEAQVGDTIVMSAELSDANGDAAAGGTDIDGDGPKLLVGNTISFFYDVDNDGRASADELVGTAETNALGVASIEFTIDPAFIVAGTYDAGLQAEFSGDNHYGIARASAQIIVHPGDVDVDRTVLEADPDTIEANGSATTTLRARLVDEFNNLLDPEAEPHEVRFTTDLGILLEEAELDPASGTYTQVLRAQRKGGPATVQVFIDDEPGPKIVVTFTGGSTCACASARTDAAPIGAALLLVLGRLLRRSKRPG